MASIVSSNPLGSVEYNPSATSMAGMPQQTLWTYVQDRNGRNLIEPVVGFYFNPPVGARCRWSTDNGSREPQHLRRGFQLPRRTLILWSDEKLDAEAALYREKYWEDMKTLTAPRRLEDLYEYFDSATLWKHGAINLWNVINILAADAGTNWYEHENRIAYECNSWVLDWLENFPTAQFNRENLMKWNQKTDILPAVTTQYDWAHDLRDLDLVSQNILRECFLFHFERLTGKKPAVACFNHHAAEDIAAAIRVPAQSSVPAPAPRPAPARGPLVVSSDPAFNRLQDSQPPFEPGSPPSKGLATIPEHASPVKSSAKANGLTIDTMASNKPPKHTVSAPATSVPRIAVTPHVPGEAKAEAAPIQTDGSDSTNDEFFDPRALAEKIEVKARQLSAQSAPGDTPEFMLGARMNDDQPRAASTTLAIPRHALPAKPTVAFPATKENHDTDKPPSAQAARKGPHRNDLGQHQGVTTVPTYQLPQQPMAQQGGPMGPIPHQHTMPPFGPHSSMQQPPAGFIPANPPHPNDFAPQGPLRPVIGMPAMGMPNVMFQGQISMPPPGMDMPPFISPQGQPAHAPPQYMAQKNVGIPMYQPNGYIAQPQQQQHRRGSYSANQQTKQTKQNARRGSMNSNGSRKVRDDPLHGPVYAMNPRKSSNTSPGSRKPSNLKPEHTPDVSYVPCVNSWLDQLELSQKFRQLFDECHCPRCLEASRSLYIKHGDDSVSEDIVKTSLLRYFSGWEPTSVRAMNCNRAAVVGFKTDHGAVSALQNFWSSDNKQTIPGLPNNAFVWYPLYSKHYTSKDQNPRGAPRGLVEAQNMSRRLSGHSVQRRGSNPYLGQRPMFNNPNFGQVTPGPQQPQPLREQQQQQMNDIQPGAPHAVPYLPEPPQVSKRTLWKPPADDSRPKSSTAQSAKQDNACSPKTRPHHKAVETPVPDEDWRSKPPSEEAIEDPFEEVIVADTASNDSSQGARSIKVCLPVETGSVRSRSVSPVVEDSPAQEQAEETSIEVGIIPQEESEKETACNTVEEENAVVGADTKSSSSYSMAATELAVAVEDFRPIDAFEQSPTTAEKDNQKTAYSYSKVTSELVVPTEVVDINTVIRHKPQKSRSIILIEWNEPLTSTSELQGRFTDLQDEFAPALVVDATKIPTDETEGAGTMAAADGLAETAPQEGLQATQPKKKAKKSKKKQAQANLDAPTSGPSTNTSSKTHSRGPSRTSTSRPESRASTKRPQSAAGTTAETSSRPSSAMMQDHLEDDAPVVDGERPVKRKKNKSQRRSSKQTPAAESSTVSEGQAKTGGSQDQGRVHGRVVTGEESPRKKTKTAHPRPDPAEKSSASEPTNKAADDDSRKAIDEQQVVSKDADYRANAGGSLRLKKNRSPNKSQQKSDQKEDGNDKKTPIKHEPKSLQTIFEPPSEGDRKHVSPDANLFPQQKFAIDQAKASAPPKMSINHKENVKPSGNTVKLTTNNNVRIGSLPPGFNPYPQLPPNTKPSAWSTIARRNVNEVDDDPFSVQHGEDQSRNWMKDKAVKPPTQKPRGEEDEPTSTSPTPSPDKKRQGHWGDKVKKQLNATAKAFTPSSSMTPSIISQRTTTTIAHVGAATTETSRSITTQPIPHHVKRPSLPGQKGDSTTDTRFITPAEQTLDPAKVEQPGPPTKERKKRVDERHQQQRQQHQKQLPTAAQVAAAAAGNSANAPAPAPGNTIEFPTLAVAVMAPKKQAASFARAVSATMAPSTAASQKGEEARPAPPAPVTSPDSVKPGQGVGVPASVSAAGASVRKAEQEEPKRDDWTTVGPSKKTGGKNPTTDRAAGGGGGGGKGGKLMQQGNRGASSGRAPVGEERKGG
ncbi:hypothetical protein VPNG_02884 [Cytospora leucostoma]|uniref:RRM domain-containing protein n=1 Tax=Cytospora leucostoma TaxID=1230097 RepID=A0A423XK55_9PEZI|nr:hypothetical protein VPNG_02884 [Cytospora leucostoma]